MHHDVEPLGLCLGGLKRVRGARRCLARQKDGMCNFVSGTGTLISRGTRGDTGVSVLSHTPGFIGWGQSRDVQLFRAEWGRNACRSDRDPGQRIDD